MGMELDQLEEKSIDAQLWLTAYHARSTRYYNRMVRQSKFKVGDLVIRVVTPNTKPKNFGALEPT